MLALDAGDPETVLYLALKEPSTLRPSTLKSTASSIVFNAGSYKLLCIVDARSSAKFDSKLPSCL